MEHHYVEWEHHLHVPVAGLSSGSMEHNPERSPQVIVLSLSFFLSWMELWQPWCDQALSTWPDHMIIEISHFLGIIVVL